MNPWVTGEHTSWVRDFDPVIRFIRDGLEAGFLNKEDLLERDARICARIAEARAFGEASAYPDPESGRDNVFAA